MGAFKGRLVSLSVKSVQSAAKTILVLVQVWLAGCHASDRVKPNPTFSEDVAPIVFKNCSPCHRPGEAGPFPLLTFEDVVKKAKTIAAVTQARYMPTWPADPSYSHFTGERVLKDAEIETIKRWVANGSPAGESARLPPQPVFPRSSVFGKPDLMVKMREVLEIP